MAACLETLYEKKACCNFAEYVLILDQQRFIERFSGVSRDGRSLRHKCVMVLIEFHF